MQGEGSGYVAGDPYGQCRRCGLTYRLSAFREEWTGGRVCRDCHDPKPSELSPPTIGAEGLIRSDAQPQLAEVEQQPVTADDL